MPDNYLSLPDMQRERRLFTFTTPLMVRVDNGGERHIHSAEGVINGESGPHTILLVLDGLCEDTHWFRPRAPIHVYVNIDAIASAQVLP